MTLCDETARTKAVNPTLSAIVQAPAGSGKTELLTSRFLNLLMTVDAPEHVVALTFTRKAAHEMQNRILSKLQTHEALLKRDKALDWQLLENPHRLRVTTLDSLCQSLTRAIPLQEKHVPYATVTDTPSILYWQAAREAVTYALKTEAFEEAITVLLTHLDNRLDILLELLVEQLAKRDLWLQPIYQAKLQDKAALETALKTIETHAIEALEAVLLTTPIDDLCALASEVATLDPNPLAPREALKSFDTPDALNRESAKALASLLLTTQKKFRKSFDHHVGLKRENCPKDRYKTLKAESKALLETLENTPGLLEALLRVRALPEPTYPDTEWAPLQALLTLLPLLAGHLQLVFETAQSTDFIGVTHQALDALGFDDAPTDLALYLDYNIQHLLVDEFQDTSIQQFELIKRLVRGFEPGDGRTLFLVGDPMQSIYRFRAAEVGLFLRAQHEGIGDVKPEPLYLKANFRSNAPLIDWINQHFSAIFPQFDNLESGAVSFHASVPTKLDTKADINAYAYANSSEEAFAIADLCASRLHAAPEESIAILVRSRRQLPEITRALDAKKIDYQGLDTDLTVSLSHVKDVLSITKALLMPTHRLAWLSVLRSPFCGLTLPDLHKIANHAPKQSIPYALQSKACLKSLSETGEARVRFVYGILENAIQNRHQENLVIWILDTLKALHIHEVLSPDAMRDLEPIWEALESFEKDGLLSELTRFEKTIETLYSKKTKAASLQLMTIHKAKGLEFDTVILPGMGRRAPPKDRPLLRWLKLPNQDNRDDLILISPLNAAPDNRSALYDYLGEIDEEKNQHEQTRLLYVAATRAKQRLYLTDSSEAIKSNTFRHTLNTYPFEVIPETNQTESQDITLPHLCYLPDIFYEPKPHPITHTPLNPPSTLPDLNPARTLGTITHALLEWICTYHPENIDDIPWQLSEPALQALDLSQAELKTAKAQIRTWITNFLNHPRGAWIAKKHTNEHSEYVLLVFENNRQNTRVIDRLFEDNGILWIIDFKTGEKNTEHYQIQLNRYASYMSAHTKLPIRCGLYYLEDADWVEWAFQTKQATIPELY